MNTLSKIIPFTGFSFLTIMMVVLLLSAISEAWAAVPAAGVIAILITFGSLVDIYFEGKNLLTKTIEPVKFYRKAFEFLAVVIGGLLAFYLSTDLGLGAVIAASLVGIIADMIVPKYGVPAYCGSFVGMSSNALFFNLGEVALASAIAGIVYVLAREVYGGFGGKLGTIAFVGASTAGFGLGREFLIAPIADWQTNLWVLLIAFIAAPLTFYLSLNRKNGPVLASGAVGLIGGLILPILSPQYGSTLAVVAICASFTGMSSAERCCKFWHILIASLFTGYLFIFATPLLGGAGGKLGTIAFASMISMHGLITVFQRAYGSDARSNADECP